MTPAQQLKGFIGKFSPAHQKLIHAVRKSLRKRFPTAYEMVYDNYNFFVIGYGPTERPSEAVISMVCGTNGVGICFIYGAGLPDPDKLLRGSGNQTRSIHLESAADLERPAVKALLAAATSRAKPFRASGKGELVIRSVSKKQRPRQKPA